jgi:hypothetical protein
VRQPAFDDLAAPFEDGAHQFGDLALALRSDGDEGEQIAVFGH